MMAVQAAIEGQSLALAPCSIVAEDLEAGRLIKLFFDIPGVRVAFSYYIVARPDVARKARAVAFRDWVLADASVGT